jgi:hypothetical protein
MLVGMDANRITLQLGSVVCRETQILHDDFELTLTHRAYPR